MVKPVGCELVVGPPDRHTSWPCICMQITGFTRHGPEQGSASSFYALIRVTSFCIDLSCMQTIVLLMQAWCLDCWVRQWHDKGMRLSIPGCHQTASSTVRLHTMLLYV